MLITVQQSVNNKKFKVRDAVFYYFASVKSDLIFSVKNIDYESETYSLTPLYDDTGIEEEVQITNIPFSDTRYRTVDKPEAKNDKSLIKLVSEIIKDALACYFAEPIPYNPRKLTAKERIDMENKNLEIIRGKKVAELFFNKSRLFKLTQIDKEYLIKHYEKIKDSIDDNEYYVEDF